MKKGTAIREKESVAVNIRCTIIRSGTSPFTITATEESAMEKATGTPKISRTINAINSNAAILCFLLSQ